jgi:hypothetical protein
VRLPEIHQPGESPAWNDAKPAPYWLYRFKSNALRDHRRRSTMTTIERNRLSGGCSPVAFDRMHGAWDGSLRAIVLNRVRTFRRISSIISLFLSAIRAGRTRRRST